MKNTIFAAFAALCLLAGTGAFAQPAKKGSMPKERPTAEQMAQRMTERMTQKLNLNETQAKQVYDVNLAQVKTMEAMREQMRQARNAEAEKMKGILTTEQFMQWSQMQGPRYGEHRGKMYGEGRDGKKCRQGKDCPRKGNGSKPADRKN